MESVSQTNTTIDSTVQANYENLFNRAFRRQAFAANSATDNLDYQYHSNGTVLDNTFHRPDAEMQKCLVIVSGPPGSGKSTWANEHFVNVFSADDYMTVDGQYHFDRERIGEVHRRCEDGVLEAMGDNKCVVYCNTNTQFSDFRNLIFKLRRQYDLDQDFSCTVYIAKMADLNVETLTERVSENGNGHCVESYKLHNSRNRWNWLFNIFDPKYLSWCRIAGYIVPTHNVLRQNRCFNFPGPYMSAQPRPTYNQLGSDITSDLSSPTNNRIHFHRNNRGRVPGRGRGRGRGRSHGRGRGGYRERHHGNYYRNYNNTNNFRNTTEHEN